jgi:UTP--glucose-1-phosphate uridylyltransferase
MSKVRKAVIPAAGHGTRFLPATKAQPKEMLPVVDKPVIQYVVEEAAMSGIEDILIITGRGKRAVEDHFDANVELEQQLEAKNRQEDLEEMERIANLANIHYIRQGQARGLGDAILQARWHVEKEPFLVLLGDTIIESKEPLSKQLIDAFEEDESSIIAVEEVPKEKVGQYGIVKCATQPGKGEIADVEDLIEKPDPEEAPSNLAIAGRYILTPGVFSCLEETRPGKGDEIQLTDAIRLLMSREKIKAYLFDGMRHDIGNRLDYLKTTIRFGLQREDLGADLLDYLKGIAE